MARVYDGFDERLELPVAVEDPPAPDAGDSRHEQTVQTRGADRGSARPSRHRRRLGLRRGSLLRPISSWSDCRAPRCETRSCADPSRGNGSCASWRRRSLRWPPPTSSAFCTANIKPSNILLRRWAHEDHRLRHRKELRRRGRSRAVADDMTMTGVVLGTPGYLAPERRSGQPATVQSDLYAVGAVMVEALDRKAPGSRSRSDRAPSSAVPRCRPSRPGRRSVRSVHLGNRHAAGAGNPTNRATGPPTAPDHADDVDVGRPSGCRSPRWWRDRDVVLAAGRAATNRAHPGTASPGPRRCRRRGSRRRAVPGGGATAKPENRPP